MLVRSQVAAVEQNQGAVQRPRFDGPKQWPPRSDYPKKPFDGQRRWQPREKFTYEQMLDRPCSHHSALIGRPSNHTNRQCAWTVRMSQGDGILPPAPARPPQLTGPNMVPVGPRPNVQENAQPKEGVNQVQNMQPNQYEGRNQYQDAEATYVVFVSKPTDKQSLNRMMREVNAVMQIGRASCRERV